MDTVGSRLKTIRTQKGLTLDQLAEKAGISKSFLWEVEQDRSDIRGEKLVRVADVLGASLDYLLRGEKAPADYHPAKIEIPRELDEFAEEKRLTYRQTLALLEIGHSVIARRSSKGSAPVTKDDWARLYEGVKSFLEDKK